VVILGQDPYHGPGQAMGLSFSVPPGVAIPPSLRNIFKEVCSDLSCGGTPANGDLTPWADQGVLLLNSVLTVSPDKPASHAGHGWERFTDKAIQILAEQRHDLVFMLWGAYAQRKAEMIDSEKHLLIKSSHPSPLSASRGFLGSRPFTRANAWMVENGEETVDWNHWK
jgi:uracil-DNA glycosylase